MAKKKNTTQSATTPQGKDIPRPPVVAVMGHIDHGKSTLLDYIRSTNVAGGEAGGITQHISAYEFEHTPKEDKDTIPHRITFLDTPGHEAFAKTRIRGAQAADIAILVVSADDGVKPQTKEALKYILEAKTPFVVAINKIDLPASNIEKTKTDLAENGVYLEGYGGDIPNMAISAKTGENVEDLLDLLLFMAEFNELRGDTTVTAEGVVIESTIDKQKGMSTSLIIKNGTLKSGMAVATDIGWAPVRIMEDFKGKQLREATFSSPIKIFGWSALPEVGTKFVSFANKKDAQKYVEDATTKEDVTTPRGATSSEKTSLGVVIVADTTGTLQAVVSEIEKLSNDRIEVTILGASTGVITEKEIKLASTHENTFVVGFNTSMDSASQNASERYEVEVKTFNIIYELIDWTKERLTKLTPIEKIEEMSGRLKVLKTFNKTKNNQVIGGKVVEGYISVGDTVKILRRDEEIGRGKIKGLQQQSIKADKVEEGNECGLQIEAKKEIGGGDVIEAFHEVER